MWFANANLCLHRPMTLKAEKRHPRRLPEMVLIEIVERDPDLHHHEAGGKAVPVSKTLEEV